MPGKIAVVEVEQLQMRGFWMFRIGQRLGRELWELVSKVSGRDWRCGGWYI